MKKEESGKLRTIKDVYLLSKIGKGGDYVEVDESLKLDMAERQGNKYASFFNLCRVESAFKGSKIKKGDEVIVHHFVMDNEVYVKGKTYMLCYTEDIFAVKVGESKTPYLRNFEGIKGVITIPQAKEVNSYFTAFSPSKFWDENYSVGFDGVEYEYISDSDYELYYDEILHFFVKFEDCFLIGGKVNDPFIELEKKGDLFYTEGKAVICRKADVTKSRKGRYFIHANNIYGFA
jgi:hypothetical protein